MIDTLRRPTSPPSPLPATRSNLARSVGVSALGSLALAAMFATPAALASSTGAGIALLSAFVIAGSAAAILLTSDLTLAWRLAIAAAAIAGVG